MSLDTHADVRLSFNGRTPQLTSSKGMKLYGNFFGTCDSLSVALEPTECDAANCKWSLA